MKVSDFEMFVQNNTKIHIDDLNYSVVGLCGEAGEVAEWFKKAKLRGNEKFTADMLKSELGDVLHYVTRIAIHHGWNLKDCMTDNIAKLTARDAVK